MASHVISDNLQEYRSELDKKELPQTHVKAVGEYQVAAGLNEKRS